MGLFKLYFIVFLVIFSHKLDIKRENMKFGITSLTLGLAKEIYDSTQKNNKFDYKDLFADIIGTFLGVYSSKNFGIYNINSKSAYGFKIKF